MRGTARYTCLYVDSDKCTYSCSSGISLLSDPNFGQVLRYQSDLAKRPVAQCNNLNPAPGLFAAPTAAASVASCWKKCRSVDAV